MSQNIVSLAGLQVTMYKRLLTKGRLEKMKISPDGLLTLWRTRRDNMPSILQVEFLQRFYEYITKMDGHYTIQYLDLQGI